MKFLNYLKEDYITNIEGDVPIYKNPTGKDFREILSYSTHRDACSVRCVIDIKHKDIYVWDAFHAVHIDGIRALKKVGLNISNSDAYRFFCDEGYIKNGKIQGNRAIPYKDYIKYYLNPINDPDAGEASQELELHKDLPYDDYSNVNLDWLKKYFIHKPIMGTYNNAPEIIFKG
jgi:hypothetical protein